MCQCAFRNSTFPDNEHTNLAVSPWQFKELGDGQDWVEQCDTLWKYRWEQAVHDVEPDIIEILTWNDYGPFFLSLSKIYD